MYHPLLL